MRRSKPQKGNQLDCHAGPYNQNSRPLTAHKAPYKPHKHRSERFFKPEEPRYSIAEPSDLPLTVTCLVTSLSHLSSGLK